MSVVVAFGYGENRNAGCDGDEIFLHFCKKDIFVFQRGIGNLYTSVSRYDDHVFFPQPPFSLILFYYFTYGN